jgi:chemotaxis protein histidine kinase CheA
VQSEIGRGSRFTIAVPLTPLEVIPQRTATD